MKSQAQHWMEHIIPIVENSDGQGVSPDELVRRRAAGDVKMVVAAQTFLQVFDELDKACVRACEDKDGTADGSWSVTWIFADNSYLTWNMYSDLNMLIHGIVDGEAANEKTN
jgi:hypothetical protein